MLRRRRSTFVAGAALALALAAPRAEAQVPKGVAAVTLSWQYVDNTGHRMTDGFLVERGQSVTTSFSFEMDYGVTDRLSASVGIPFVFARYTGALPAFSGRAIDSCRCWHSSLQDFALSARYRLGNDAWSVTPFLRYTLPSHDYAFQGEAVVGRNLRELQLGAVAGLRLASVVPGASVQGGYSYGFVEKVLDIPIDRSLGFFELGYAVNRKLYLRATAVWQRTHGGLRFGSVTGDPFFPPGEVNTPAKQSQRDRLLKTHYWQVGGGVSYSIGEADVFASVLKYVWGRDAHDGEAYTLGATFYFDLGR